MPPRPNSQMEPSSQCAISKSPNLLGISVDSMGPQSPLVAGARPIFKRQALQTPCGKSAESSLPQLLQTRCGSFRALPPTPVDGVTWSSAGTLPIKGKSDAKGKPASRRYSFRSASLSGTTRLICPLESRIRISPERKQTRAFA
jgi:hypothetical protein